MNGDMKGRASLLVFPAMVSVYFFAYFQRVAVPGTIFNELQADLGLSAASVASLGSMFTWIYGGMQVFVGMLTDRFGGRRTLFCGGLIMAAGAILFPLAHSFPFLFAARILTGLGSGFIYLSIIRELAILYGARHFTVLVGVMLFLGYGGGMTATLPLERAAAAAGWRQALFAAGLLTAAVTCAAGIVLRPFRRDPTAGKPLSFGPLADVLRNRPCRPLLAASLFSFPIYYGVQTVLGKKFLQDFAGLSSGAAALLILVMTAASAASVAAGGLLPRLLADRRKPVLLGCAALLACACGALLWGVGTRGPAAVYSAGFILLAVSCGSVPAAVSVMKELNPPGAVAPAVSVINALTYIGGGIIGQGGGIILDRYKDRAVMAGGSLVYPQEAYAAVFVFLSSLAALNFIFTLFVPETFGRGMTREKSGGAIG